MNRRFLTQFSLKWNPFALDVPVEALYRFPETESFLFRVENLARDGGFALVTGHPGMGKSVTLRILADHLSRIREMKIGVLTRPQCNVADLYRELGDLFGVELTPHNRWAGTKVLRERWRAFMDTALFRPVLLVDEAQEMAPTVLNELRILMSTELDSCLLLTVVLAGDQRLQTRLTQEDLLPLATRIRTRLVRAAATTDDLVSLLCHAIEQAGNPQLMTKELVDILAEQSAGNLRAMTTMAAQLLETAAEKELPRLDEKLFFETFHVPGSRRARKNGGRS
jgi:type II secretory pathway predicted ATPase ExeA